MSDADSLMCRTAVFLILSLLVCPARGSAPGLDQIVKSYVALQVEADPMAASLAGLPGTDPNRLPDHTAKAIALRECILDRLWQQMQHLAPGRRWTGSDFMLQSNLAELLQASRGLRVCRSELWDVNHLTGWQIEWIQSVAVQPVDSEADRHAVLARARALPKFVTTEITNLRKGLKLRYSAPRSVVTRVISQLTSLLELPAGDSPLRSPASRANDQTFRSEYEEVLQTSLLPAIRRYRDFLATEYLPSARSTLALADLPRGRACYIAQLRRYTTLKISPEDMAARGEAAVADNQEAIRTAGQNLFGLESTAEIVRRVANAPDNHFASREEFVDYSTRFLDRARTMSRELFVQLPAQPIRIEPIPALQTTSGIGASYGPQRDPHRPATFRIPDENWASETRGASEVAVVHEALPGHHLQVALSRELRPSLKFDELFANAAYVEGWARYAEWLGESAGMYQSPYALIARRAWLARGMVVDPGIHVMDWSRKHALDYLLDSGRFTQPAAEALLDRIAVLPGQLTAYDAGGLQILQLRKEAEPSARTGVQRRAISPGGDRRRSAAPGHACRTGSGVDSDTAQSTDVLAQ